MNKNKKLIKKGIVISVITLAVVGGSASGVMYLKKNNAKTVAVTPVSVLNGASFVGYGDDDGVSGMVVSDVSQNIRVPEDKVIDKVYVSEGDKVKIGDKLLSYDTTLLELDQELQELTVQELGLEIKAAEADLVKLKNTTPVANSAKGDSGTSLLDEMQNNESDDSDDGSDEEAKLVNSDRVLLASQEQGNAQASIPETDGETAAADESDSDIGQETSVTEIIEETEQEIIAGEETSGDVLTGKDLENLPSNEKEEQETSDIENSKESEKAEKNLSLEKFLKNVRVKALEGEEEILLADTKNGGTPSAASENDIKLIPHFSETVNDHFQNNSTYAMLIKGIALQREISGKVYGIAEINGDDYPEIGGFTLAPKSDLENVAVLTIAFHDGLEQQHEISGELQDMYVEITLNADEVLPGEMVFRTSNDIQKDQVILIEKGQQEETDVEIGIVAETEDEGSQEMSEDQSQTGEQEDTENQDETEQSQPISDQVKFQVIWKHGTNSSYNWPAALKVYFYTHEEDDDPSWTLDLMQKTSNPDAGSIGSETGASSIDEEETTEMSTEAGTEGKGEESAETEKDTEAAADEASDPSEEIVDSEDTYPSGVVKWNTIEEKWPSQWPEGKAIPYMEEGLCWAYAPNYIPSISKDPSTGTYTIIMTYVEPAESPLQKLNPISELTYQNGVNTEEGVGQRAYKGSGTADDPYVFFVTDGVTIKNTFVNWVLGFNEDGTQRISGGYYIRLEIRESDTITGAFIRSVDLDGTVQTETGYGPGTYWVFSSDTGIVKYEEEIQEEAPSGMPGGGPGWNDSDGTYTAEELAIAIAEKEQEIKKLKLDTREAELKLKKFNKDLAACVVVSAVDGYVKQIGGSENEAYMTVSSENGMYVKTTVGELELNDIAVNEMVSCQSWDTGMTFSAKITQIEQFPDTSDNGYSYGTNMNSSNYPVLAVVEDGSDLSEYESVSVKYPIKKKKTGDVYIEKQYIRSENGQSYVYIAGPDDKLKKQYIHTGGSVYTYVEITQGLSTEDKIAFPYGKNVKEGTKVTYEDE